MYQITIRPESRTVFEVARVCHIGEAQERAENYVSQAAGLQEVDWAALQVRARVIIVGSEANERAMTSAEIVYVYMRQCGLEFSRCCHIERRVGRHNPYTRNAPKPELHAQHIVCMLSFEHKTVSMGGHVL